MLFDVVASWVALNCQRTEVIEMRTRRQKLTLREKKRQSKLNRMTHAKGNSNYARKSKTLNSLGGWGFEYKDKPWK